MKNKATDLPNEQKTKAQASPEGTQDTIDTILKRLLADVDDNMEFIGSIFNPKDNAHRKVKASLKTAHSQISQLITEARVQELKKWMSLAEHQGKLDGNWMWKNQLTDRITELKATQSTNKEKERNL